MTRVEIYKIVSQVVSRKKIERRNQSNERESKRSANLDQTSSFIIDKVIRQGLKKRKVRIKTSTFYQTLDKTRRYESFLGGYKNILFYRSRPLIQVFLEHTNCLVLLILFQLYLFMLLRLPVSPILKIPLGLLILRQKSF